MAPTRCSASSLRRAVSPSRVDSHNASNCCRRETSYPRRCRTARAVTDKLHTPSPRAQYNSVARKSFENDLRPYDRIALVDFISHVGSDRNLILRIRNALAHQHGRVRTLLKLPVDFVLHSLRHSYGTRLGEAGADAFTIMRLMGHSTVTVSQRYVHPSPEAVELAFERLMDLNLQKAATVSATVSTGNAASVQQVLKYQ